LHALRSTELGTGKLLSTNLSTAHNCHNN
jgi:hypothetical protein